MPLMFIVLIRFKDCISYSFTQGQPGNILVAQVSLKVDFPRVFCLASTFILCFGLSALAASLFFR